MHRWRVLLIPLLAVAFAVATATPATAASIQKDTYVLAECNSTFLAPPDMWVTGGAVHAVTHVDMLMQYEEYLLNGGTWQLIGSNDVTVYGVMAEQATALHGTYDMTLDGIGHFTGSYAMGNTGSGRAVGTAVDGSSIQKLVLGIDPTGMPAFPGACWAIEMTELHW